MDESLFTAAELADFLRIPKRAVYDLARRGTITYYRIGRQLRFEPEDVLATLKVERFPLLPPAHDSSGDQAEVS